MQTTPLLVLLGLAAAGGGAWLLLGSDASESCAGPAEPLRHGPRERAPEPAPVVAPTAVAANDLPPAQEPDDPEWITRPLKLPPGKGALKGSDLIAAVEGAGKLRFRGKTDADLEALKKAVLDDVDRETEQPYAAMMGWLKEAGFEVDVSWPQLVVRRRTDEEFANR